MLTSCYWKKQGMDIILEGMPSRNSYVSVKLLYRLLPSCTISRTSSFFAPLVPAEVDEEQSGSHIVGNQEMKRSDLAKHIFYPENGRCLHGFYSPCGFPPKGGLEPSRMPA
jgi:hypothetical protein